MSEELNIYNFKNYIDDFFNDLELYDDYDGRHDYKGILKASIDVFLNFESDYTAKEVYRSFFMIYQITGEDKSKREDNKNLISEPNTLLNLLNVMEKYEKNTGELIDRQRDHFIHSVNVFLLGLAIYTKNKRYRRAFKNYVKKSQYEKYYGHENNEVSREEFLYRWGVASLLHDIGYPFEIVGKQLKKIINDGVKSISNSYSVNLGIDFDDFDEFNSIVKMDPYDFADNYRKRNKRSKVLDLYKPTDILAHKVAKDFKFNNEKFRLLKKHLDGFIYYMREKDFIDHGFYSAILVLNSYGKILQKYDKNNIFFFYPIVDSASAILLHNYYNKTLQKDPFNLKKLSPKSNPIAYLLILCDELQEWNRQPFGQIDKQKLHVNELSISIGENSMDVIYIIKNGSMGLGFSKDKRDFINNVLDIESIFVKGIFVSSDVEPDIEEGIMRNIDFEEIQAPDILIKNIEELASKINANYNNRINQDYDEAVKSGEEIDENLEISHNSLVEFNELSPEYKLSNLRQARSIPKKLNLIGCEIAPQDDEREEITFEDLDEKEIENLAIFEHQEWCREKRGTGWTYGPVKDEVLRENPNIVGWDELSDEIKQYDVDTIVIIPELLNSLGLKVVRSKIRLLTYKMQEYFEKNIEKDEYDPELSSEDNFKKLPDYVKYTNYKQTNFIIKILNERGYDIIDKNDKIDAIKSGDFDEHDLEHFAEREHYGWCMLKYDLGWRHGPLDVEEKTSPNLVKWEDLDEELQENNMNTFRNLPDMCDEVGLQIVKSE
ncbi:RyR domain-containing protein [uncultured Methanobrevibacter sp.]|uniref:RyR domain-containing protein n=1 Tax=uncultured Methanobrevibacter sp. TaxID=253161 RepID=UPI0025E8A803|nr:RyR domain-containing protein [uncultured Methanobrevibacter sp.]